LIGQHGIHFFAVAADTFFMNSVLLGTGLIIVGVVHIVAAHKEWGWYVNNYQIKPILKSKGHSGLKLYTYLMCSPCIGFGVYMLVSGDAMSS